MAQRKVYITIKNTGKVSVSFNIGFGLASATFDPTKGFPRPPYLGDIVEFGGSPADFRNETLSVGESKRYTVTFYDDKLIGKYNTAYFLICIWDPTFSKIYAYKFAQFSITAPPSPPPAPTTYKGHLDWSGPVYISLDKKIWYVWARIEENPDKRYWKLVAVSDKGVRKERSENIAKGSFALSFYENTEFNKYVDAWLYDPNGKLQDNKRFYK